MDEGLPALGVGFGINVGDSFSELAQLERVMDSTTTRVLAEAAQIERATSGMLKLGGASVQISSFGNSVSKEAAASSRELARIEKAGEGLVRQLDRQTLAYGKTKEEMRLMRVEAQASAAQQAGLSELATRLRAKEMDLAGKELAAARAARFEAEAAAEAKQQAAIKAANAAALEARAVQNAAVAYQMFQARVQQGVAAMREQEAAVERDAAALAHLRAMLDPAAAAQDRLNKELAESHRLLVAAGADTQELARAEQLLKQRHTEVGQSSSASRAAMQNLGFQVQDFAVQVVGGTSALRAFAMQAPQAAGALTGFEGKLGAVGRFLNGPLGIALTLATVLLAGFADELFKTDEAATKAADGLKKFQDRQSDIGNYIESTTGKLIEQNRNLVQNAILLRSAEVDANKKLIKDKGQSAFGSATVAAQGGMLGLVGGAVTGVSVTDDAILKVVRDANNDVLKLDAGLQALAKRRPDLRASIKDYSDAAAQTVFLTRENVRLGKEIRALGGDTTALGTGTSSLIEKQVALATATTPLIKARAELALVQERGAAADKVGGAALVKYRDDLTVATRAVIAAEAAEKAANDARRQNGRDANHAEQLGREAEAQEAQIRNLFALTDAYKLSGGAALIAEARVKAESAAIRQRGDIEAAVDRQVRINIAQRTSDGEKTATAMDEQARAQEEVNRVVAAGIVPAERAAQLLQQRLALLPLVAAVEAAEKRGLTNATITAQTALDDLTKAQERQRAAQATMQFQGAMFAGDNRLAELREELRLVGETDAVRVHALATLRATQEAGAFNPQDRAAYIQMQVVLADETQRLAREQVAYNDLLSFTADRWDLIARNVQNAARGMADAFGDVGRAIGDMAGIYAGYHADRERQDLQHQEQLKKFAGDQRAIDRENAKYALATATSQIGAFGDMTSAAKGFFDEKSKGYQALVAAEKMFRAVEFALSVRAMAQDIAETGSKLATGAARIASGAVEAVVNSIKSLPFPLNIAAGAATVAALAGIGVSLAGGFGGGKNSLPQSNTGVGTVLGNSGAKSDSIKNAIDALKEVDLVTNSYSREMAASLKSIDSQIGGFASVLVRNGNINASGNVQTGFQRDAIGSTLNSIIGGGLLSKIPVLGGIFSAIGNFVGSLFGARIDVTGSGLYGGAQSLGSVKEKGFDADYYSDIVRTKKTFGIVTGRSYWTEYQDADPALANQFTLILRQFNDAVAAAAGPLGMSTAEVERRLNAFVVDIGRIDLQGLSGEQIQEKLTAVFGAVGDNLANAVFPGMLRFQQVGEGAFETLVRVASTVEAVTTTLDLLGSSARNMSIDAKLGLADQFESLSAMSSVTQSYFESFYSKEEQAAARTAQFGKVFESMGLTMPATLAAFRQLVEAQNLTTEAGRETFGTLLQLAPAFAELKTSMEGAKSAADILSERQDLQRQLLELDGNTAAIRALDLAKLDASNRALQEQVWAVQDAQAAAKAAQELKEAWTSVGDSIMDEVRRIRGLTGNNEGGSFAMLMGQFNVATSAARLGDQDAAKSLPGLSQSLLKAAADAATSRQELDRVQAQTAASLEQTYGAIAALTGASGASTAATLAAAATAAQAASGNSPAASNDDLVAEVKALREEISQLRAENVAGHAATASNTGKSMRILENVSSASGGEAISVASAA